MMILHSVYILVVIVITLIQKRKKICHLTTAVSARPISRLKVINLLKLSILEQFVIRIMDNKIKSNYN